MDDTKRKSDRILKVERGFEWSRIEEELMTSAYEHVLPTLRASPGGSATEQVKAGSNGRSTATSDQRRYAKGA